MAEDCERKKDENFNILGWWKIISIGLKCHEIFLPALISTISFEFTFGMKGRIFDPFRSPLGPKKGKSS